MNYKISRCRLKWLLYAFICEIVFGTVIYLGLYTMNMVLGWMLQDNLSPYQVFLCLLTSRLLQPIVFREKYFFIYDRIKN